MAHSGGSGRHAHRKNNNLSIYIALIFAVLAVIIACVLLILHRNNTNSTSNAVNVSDTSDDDLNDSLYDRKTIEYDGQTYALNNNLSTYLVIGTDKSDQSEVNVENIDAGYICKMADTLLLVVADDSAKSFQILQLDRNTITPISVLYTDGTVYDDMDMQLCCAYFYGTTEELSCENTIREVSELLLDTPIEHYVSMGMDSIGRLNNAVGGVTVTLEDDFSSVDPSMTVGTTLKLSDEQAQEFVTGRMNIGDGNNEGRMRRQRAYMDGLKTAVIQKIKADSSYVNDLYDDLSDVMVTDVSQKTFAGFAMKLVQYENKGFVLLDGEHTEGVLEGTDDGLEHEEFIVDEDDLMKKVVELFYKLC